MNNGSVISVSVSPLTTDQRQRLECMTAVRGLWFESRYSSTPVGPAHFDIDEVLRLTEYLLSGDGS